MLELVPFFFVEGDPFGAGSQGSISPVCRLSEVVSDVDLGTSIVLVDVDPVASLLTNVPHVDMLADKP